VRLISEVNVPPESHGNEKSIWEYYNEMAAVEDNIREVEWRDLADTVLVFVCQATLYSTYLLTWFQDGLFAAFLSAFLVFLIPRLESNSTDVTMDVLIHISQQLSNSTTPAFEPVAFQVSAHAATVNMLFFLSLALVLVDAFLAMLVKGWLQEFDRGWRKCTVAHLRAEERERRMQELERWKLHELVALLPILIQGSLLLFCFGLLVLIFPLHRPSAILCSLIFVSVIGFYGFTSYVSIVDNYAPFSSPVSRLLARGLAMLQTWHTPPTQTAQRTAPAFSFHNGPPLPQGQQADAGALDGTTQPLPSNQGAQPHNPNSVGKSNTVSRSRSGIDPQTHVHVLERLVTTTAEAVENIHIFLELLDQPVKDPTLRPFDMEKWRELLHITFRLLRDQSKFSVSAAWSLARSMMICYNREAADQQLELILRHHLSSRETDNQRRRMPLSVLFSSYLRCRLGHSSPRDLWRTIAFLEPSDAADAELLWMVNTSHWAVRHLGPLPFHRTLGTPLDLCLEFFAAVMTYIASTEQSRRSKAPLTAAVIYALRTIRSTLVDSIEGLYTLPGTLSTSESVPMTFCRVDGIDTLDLWSKECIQIVNDLLQWRWSSSFFNDLQLSLIAALYIDSTKQAHTRSTFVDLLKNARITDIEFEFSDAYDHGKLAVYMYMAVARAPLQERHGALPAFYGVIQNTITMHSTLQLSGLLVLEIALKHVQNTASASSDWLIKRSSRLLICAHGQTIRLPLKQIDHWVLLHLDTLLAPKPYLLLEEVGKLEWSDTPESEHIAKARLDLYDSLAIAGHEADKGPEPDPRLLRVFLWSKNYEVCTRAFMWCLDLVPISQSGAPGDANSTRMFIPETMGYEWVEHFIHVLCKCTCEERSTSWRLLISGLVPKWTVLPSPWCHDFASALLFSIVQPLDIHGLPAYQCLAEAYVFMSLHDQQAFLPFLARLLKLVKSSLTWASLTSLENWLVQLPESLENKAAHTKMRRILATRKPQLNLEFLATELAMAVTVTSL